MPNVSIAKVVWHSPKKLKKYFLFFLNKYHPYGIYHLIEENDLPDYDKKIQDFALVESIATFMC